MSDFEYKQIIIPGYPDFGDLPWEKPINEWSLADSRLEEVQHGISRHPVVFVNWEGTLYVIKEMQENIALKEYELLLELARHHLPSVSPVGYAAIKRNSLRTSVLFTRFLENSVPYRSLFIHHGIEQLQNNLLDAISGLLVQLHTNGFFWGDCSLSNILFRRDAGSLQAYLVDAETAEYHLPTLSPMLRYHDLEIMEENIFAELTNLQAENLISSNFQANETGTYIQQRYQSLWEEITKEEVFHQDELYRIQERIRSLNSLGFSVKDIELKNDDNGNKLKLRIFVSDRNFHRNQLMEITGLYAEENQAQQIMNEINELKAKMSQSDHPNITLDAVSYHWMEYIYKPIIEKLQTLCDSKSLESSSLNLVELYCEVLEHKWYMSERAQHDVGHQAAAEDFIRKFQ